MRHFTAIAACAASAMAASAAAAAPHDLQIKDAAVRLVVIPEARGDVAVNVQPGRGIAAPRVRIEGDRLVVEGVGAGERHFFGMHFGGGFNCRGRRDQARQVELPARGWTAVADLPLVTAHVPLDARVSAGQAVFGEIGAANSLHLTAAGCGDLKVADVKGGLDISESGSGDIHAGSAGFTRVSVAGSGDVFLNQVSGGLEISIAGSGDVRAREVNGPLKASINGSGDVAVEGGQSPRVAVNIAGSGDLKFGGVAGDVAANIAGSGDVTVARATGQISKRVAGSGEVRIDH